MAHDTSVADQLLWFSGTSQKYKFSGLTLDLLNGISILATSPGDSKTH